jgi:hypothetical protein
LACLSQHSEPDVKFFQSLRKNQKAIDFFLSFQEDLQILVEEILWEHSFFCGLPDGLSVAEEQSGAVFNGREMFSKKLRESGVGGDLRIDDLRTETEYELKLGNQMLKSARMF